MLPVKWYLSNHDILLVELNQLEIEITQVIASLLNFIFDNWLAINDLVQEYSIRVSLLDNW